MTKGITQLIADYIRSQGPVRYMDLVKTIQGSGLSSTNVPMTLGRMLKQGRIKRIQHGVYQYNEDYVPKGDSITLTQEERDRISLAEAGEETEPYELDIDPDVQDKHVHVHVHIHIHVHKEKEG